MPTTSYWQSLVCHLRQVFGRHPPAAKATPPPAPKEVAREVPAGRQRGRARATRKAATAKAKAPLAAATQPKALALPHFLLLVWLGLALFALTTTTAPTAGAPGRTVKCHVQLSSQCPGFRRPPPKVQGEREDATPTAALPLPAAMGATAPAPAKPLTGLSCPPAATTTPPRHPEGMAANRTEAPQQAPSGPTAGSSAPVAASSRRQPCSPNRPLRASPDQNIGSQPFRSMKTSRPQWVGNGLHQCLPDRGPTAAASRASRFRLCRCSSTTDPSQRS
jgi:hypothetical protein